MKYQRIHILGGPGSGKTTLATRIAALHGIASTDLDDLFWDNAATTYDTRRPSSERDQMLARIASQDQWIVEGVYHAWLEPSLCRCEIIIILTPSVWVRHWRIIRRFLRRRLGAERGHRRETFKGLWALLQWNHAFDGDNLERAREYLWPYERNVHEFPTVEKAFEVFSQPTVDRSCGVATAFSPHQWLPRITVGRPSSARLPPSPAL